MRIHIGDKNFQMDMDTSRMDKRFQVAQIHLDNRILRDSNVYAPEDAGELVGSSLRHTKPGTGEVIWKTPYAHYQYEGKAMVGVETKRPWARKHEPKEYNGKYLHYNKENARAHWFEEAKRHHLKEWERGVEEDLNG